MSHDKTHGTGDHTGTIGAHSQLSGVGATDHHNNANDPATGEKAALAGTSGTPGSGNKYVTDADSRNADARSPTAHHTSHEGGGGDAVAITHAQTTGQTANDHHAQSHDHSAAGDGTTLTPATLNIPAATAPAQTAEGRAVWDSDDDKLTIGTGSARKTLVNDDDSRLTDSRTPTAHHTIHENGGSDVVAADLGVATGVINDTKHGSRGSGLHTDSHAQSHDHSAAGDGTTLTPATLNIPTATAPAQTAEGRAVWDSDDDKLTIGTGSARKTLVNDDDSRLTDSRTPTAHHTSHETGGGDVVAITHAQTTGKTANDHHNQSHDHSASGDSTTLSPATLNIPTAVTPAQTADGQAVWDSDDDKLTVGTGSARKTLVNDDDSRLTDARTPTAHASTHNSGGSDVLAAFTGSGASHKIGLVPDPGASAGTTKYLREDATWVTPPGGGLSGGTPALTFGTTDSAGVATTGILTDATISLFDTTAPVTQAFGDAAATGSVGKAARRDHKHGMPADPTAGQLVLSGAVTTDTSTGAITDLAITNAVYRWNGASAATIHGITGVAEGRIVLIENVTAAQTLTLAHQSATETTAARRIIAPDAGDSPIGPGAAVWLEYDNTTARWRVVAENSYASNPAAIGTASAGTAGQVFSRGNHVHATGAGTPTNSAVGDTAATGSGPAAAMTDHVHGREGFGTPVVSAAALSAGSATTEARSDHTHDILYKVRSSDSAAKTNSTIASDDTLLFTMGASATEIWLVECFLLVSAANVTMDAKFGWTGPLGATAQWGIQNSAPASTAAFLSVIVGTTPLALLAITGTAPAGTAAGTTGVSLVGIFFGAGTSGSLALQWAQNTTDAGNLKLLKGSMLRATKLAA